MHPPGCRPRDVQNAISILDVSKAFVFRTIRCRRPESRVFLLCALFFYQCSLNRCSSKRSGKGTGFWTSRRNSLPGRKLMASKMENDSGREHRRKSAILLRIHVFSARPKSRDQFLTSWTLTVTRLLHRPRCYATSSLSSSSSMVVSIPSSTSATSSSSGSDAFMAKMLASSEGLPKPIQE